MASSSSFNPGVSHFNKDDVINAFKPLMEKAPKGKVSKLWPRRSDPFKVINSLFSNTVFDPGVKENEAKNSIAVALTEIQVEIAENPQKAKVLKAKLDKFLSKSNIDDNTFGWVNYVRTRVFSTESLSNIEPISSKSEIGGDASIKTAYREFLIKIPLIEKFIRGKSQVFSSTLQRMSNLFVGRNCKYELAFVLHILTLEKADQDLSIKNIENHFFAFIENLLKKDQDALKNLEDQTDVLNLCIQFVDDFNAQKTEELNKKYTQELKQIQSEKVGPHKQTPTTSSPMGSSAPSSSSVPLEKKVSFSNDEYRLPHQTHTEQQLRTRRKERVRDPIEDSFIPEVEWSEMLKNFSKAGSSVVPRERNSEQLYAVAKTDAEREFYVHHWEEIVKTCATTRESNAYCMNVDLKHENNLRSLQTPDFYGLSMPDTSVAQTSNSMQGLRECFIAMKKDDVEWMKRRYAHEYFSGNVECCDLLKAEIETREIQTINELVSAREVYTKVFADSQELFPLITMLTRIKTEPGKTYELFKLTMQSHRLLVGKDEEEQGLIMELAEIIFNVGRYNLSDEELKTRVENEFTVVKFVVTVNGQVNFPDRLKLYLDAYDSRIKNDPEFRDQEVEGFLMMKEENLTLQPPVSSPSGSEGLVIPNRKPFAS